MSKYIVAVPFYKNERFIDDIVGWHKSAESVRDRALIADFLVINDCPDSEGTEYLKTRCSNAGFTYIENNQNIGYLNTVNSAYKQAKLLNLSLVLLNSDIIPFSGFLYEIDQCFVADSMLGVVSARSNNATICNLYDKPHYFDGSDSLLKYQKDRNVFVKYSPQISYVPVATGFCFAIRDSVIRAFSGFDEVYTVGYEEENDYCLRISERGFRIGIANRAFVVHLEGKSFGLTGYREEVRNKNAQIVRSRYSYYDELLENYSHSLSFKLEKRIGLASDNPIRHFVDARVLSPYHNGSNKLILEFVSALSALGHTADVCAHSVALEFHGLKASEKIRYVDAPSGIYEYGFMLGQPMTESALWLVPTHSLVSICLFFDTIAHDCPQLRVENLMLDSIWSILPFVYTDISFISRHSLEQFKLKFGEGLSKLHAHLLPIDGAQFSLADSKCLTKTALVFGNKFLHKGVDLLLDELPTDNGYTYYVLGPMCPTLRQDIKFLSPGETSEFDLDQLMKLVDFVLMPSFAEGFGFPLIEALSYGKPIYCRNIDCYSEIKAVVPQEFQPLIKIVTDFSSVPNSPSIVNNVIRSSGVEDYEGYVIKIISDISEISSDSFFNRFKGRYLFIRDMPAAKFGIRGVVKSIYSTMLRSPFAPYFRRLKSMLFTSPRFVKLISG